MTKVGIVTIVSMNYGNRLQNYALQKILEELKCTAHTFRRNSSSKGIKQGIKTFLQTIMQTKGAKFRQFDKGISFANEIVTCDVCLDDLSSRFDYFIVGSDQVWNPYYDFVANKCDFLTFAEDNQKISYAASFGISEIPLERKEEYAEYLKTFKAISVREKQGAKIVKDLVGREATVVLDPTLLLNENDWKTIEKHTKLCPKHRYVLVYALGNIGDRFKGKIEQFEKKYEIFNVFSVQRNGKELPIGPSEFLYLLRNAEIILTDSFHATVFSIIFHKKFITFNRQGLNMNSRIESIAELVDLKQYINEHGDLNCEVGIDYIKVDRILKKERKKSISFLERALSD